jgi:hypothetical protein
LCDVRNITAGHSFSLEGRTPYEAIYGHTPDITTLCEFDFYEAIWYYEPNAFPEDKRFLGRWLGEAHKIGQLMCYCILTVTGKPIARSKVQSIAKSDFNTQAIKEKLRNVDDTPTAYLGATILEWSVSGVKMWAMSSQKYVKEVISCLEIELSKSGHRLTVKPVTPMTPVYRPELGVSPLLKADQANYYMSLIGILHWVVELGQIDIYIDVTLLSSFMVQPRVGHMNEVLHIFSCLKHHENSKIVFDPYLQPWDETQLKSYDWTDFYRNAKDPKST